MGKWEMVKISELCSLITDGTHQTPTYSVNGYIFLSSKNVTTGKIDWEEIKYIPQELHNQLYKRLAPQKNDILLAKNGTTGICAKVDRDVIFDIYVSLALLRPKSIIASNYFVYAINNPYTKRKFDRHLKGIGVPNLHLSSIRETSIPLPPLDEQKRIAKNLDLASEIVKGYKEQLAELDKLVQSVFYEMFGDPVTNSKKFRIKQGKDFFKLSSGKPVPPEKRFETGIPAYGGNGISWYTDNILFEQDTLIVGRVGFQSGNVRLAEGPLWVTDNAMYMSEYQSSEYNLDFLCALMKHIDFTRFQDAGDLKKITQKPFMQMRFISPPLPLQARFAAIVTEIEAQKAQVQLALTEAENLFNSLMQEYFE